MSLADVSYLFRVGLITVKMHYHYGACAFSDGLFYLLVVNLERVYARLHKHRAQAVFRNRENGRNVCICRDNHFVALAHHTHLHVSAQNKRQRIQSVSYADTVSASHIL